VVAATEFLPDGVLVRFAHTSGGLRTVDGEPPRGFEVLGQDGTYHPADAKITAADTVTIRFAGGIPAELRYAWADDPDTNLVNAAGIPAAPFRSSNR
jgi:sialate O-acetylesterase